MVGETQFTPEAAKQALNIVHSPDTAISGTANPVLEAAQKKFAAGQVEDSLKVLSGEVVPYTDKDVERVLIRNLSTKRNSTTQEKEAPTSGNEKTRFDDSKKETTVVIKFLEQKIADPAFITKMRTSMQGSGPYSDILNAMGDDTTRDAYVADFMKTPGFRENLRQIFITNYDLNKKLNSEGTVSGLELEIAKLSAQLGTEVTETQIDDAKSDVNTAETNLESHPTEILQFRTKSKRYQELTDKMSKIKETHDNSEGLGIQFEKQRTDLLTERAGLDLTTPGGTTRQAQIDAEVKKIESKSDYANYTKSKKEIAEHSTLETEIAGLQTTLGPLQKQLASKQEYLTSLLEKQKTNITPQKKAEIDADIMSKKGQLADAKATLEAEMIKFSRDVTHMGEDAMEKYVNGALSNLKNIWKEEATSQAAKDTTEEGKLAGLAIEKAYNKLCKTSTKKGELTFFKPDKSKSKILLDEALKAGGGENIAVYLETKTPVELGITAEEHTALKEKLKDPDFRKVQSEGLAKQALADYLIAGGRLNGELVESIATSDFGKALISEGRAKAEAASQQKKDLIGKGVLDKSTRFGEYLKGNWWKYGIGIIALLILLGIISTVK